MAPERFNPDYLIPGTRIGAYVVRTMLGQGGSSSVYEVESAEGHRFALKICRYPGGAYNTSEWRVDRRYSRSIACLQLLKGRRNVAELYAHDRYPDPLHGYQYLVQELVPDSLLITDWVKRESPTLRKLAGAFIELAGLCGVMASKDICHRDLKPANILATPDGTPKVIDFESATWPHAEPVTRGAASGVPGTSGWQCPELCVAILEEELEAFDFHPWGDLFSLGVVFYECLTGEHPFDTSLPEDMLLAEIAYETPIHPVRLSTAVPLGLNKVVMKLLEKQPEARYREGAEVADDLRKLLEKVKDERWDKPFKQPVPDEERAPVLPLVSALIPLSDTPPSEPHCVDTGAPADAETSREATSSRPAAEQLSASPPDAADTDVAPRREPDTAEQRGLPESKPAVGTVLDFGQAGAYTLEQRLGRGGMGEVYLARQVGAAGFRQWVAIKRVRPGAGPKEPLRFVDEARILSRLHHPNIARAYHFLEHAGSYYLVMEYVEGESLHALLERARRRGHRFSESVACAVMAEVADALHHAYHATDEAGQPLHVVHRDVSPTNILITKTGRVVLVDFGVAFNTQEGRVVTSAGFTFVKGKLPYASPEQVKLQPLDGRSDLFSVGTILTEMVTGEPPFGSANEPLTSLRIGSVTPEYVALHLPGVSKRLRAICQRLLALHPEQRFPTGGEAAVALRQHAGLAGPLSIRAELEKLQALPDTKARPPLAPEAAARALSEVKRTRRVVTLAGALMFAALALVFWRVPRPDVFAPSSPPLQGSAVSLQRPSEKTAPAPQVTPPSGPLAARPMGGGGGAVAAGPAHRRNVVATPLSGPRPGEHSAPAVVLANKRTRVPMTVTAPPAEGRADGAVRVDEDAFRAIRSALDDALRRERALREENERLQADRRSDDNSLAFLMNGDTRKVGFRRVKTERLKDGGLDIEVVLLAARGKAATVITLTNGRGNPPWKFGEARVSRNLTSLTAVPFSFTSDCDEIGPGETGKIAVVVDENAFASPEGLVDLAVQVFRGDGVEELLVNLDRALVQG